MQPNPIRRIVGLAAAMAVLTLSTAATPTSSRADETTEQATDSRPLVVMIHADWCGTCRAMSNVWAQIQQDFADRSTIVTLDVTDRPAYASSATAARELGIRKFFDRYRAKTGTIAVLACATREPVAIMNGERDLEAYRAALSKAACKTS